MAYGLPDPDYSGIDFDALSPVRRRVLKELLPMVMPSAEGSAKFDHLMTHAACNAARAAKPGFTTCGALPGFIFSRLGLHGLANYGLAGVKEAAEQHGCWANNSELHRVMYQSAHHKARRPLPGDVFIQGSLASDAEILHIGVIVNPTGDVWWTADAGQGERTAQCALYLQRTYKADTRELGSFHWRGRPSGKSRRLIGWVDLDRAVERA